MSRPNQDAGGYHGDWTRGAPMGRPSEHPAHLNPADITGRFNLMRVRLNSGGYDAGGAYWGIGAPLYYYANDHSAIDGYLRACDRDSAKARVREAYPNANFHR